MMSHCKRQGTPQPAVQLHWGRTLRKGLGCQPDWHVTVAVRLYVGWGGLVPASLVHLYDGHVNKQPPIRPGKNQMRTQR